MAPVQEAGAVDRTQPGHGKPEAKEPSAQGQTSSSIDPPSSNKHSTPSPSAEYTLHFLRSLTDVAQIQECLKQLEQEESQVDADLDEILADREKLEARLDRLEVLGPQLGNLQGESKAMIKIVTDTATLAETISVKVRQLDLEQSRVQTAIQHVEDVQELKFCISGIQKAMDQQDYEDAARYIHKAMQFDEKVLQGSFAEISVPTAVNPDYPTVFLTNAKARLLEIISSEFDQAVQRQSAEDITKFFKLFPQLGEEQAGLDKYSRFVCDIIAGKAKESMIEAYLLIRLFESIAIVIDQHQPVIEKHYGPGKMLRVIQRLQEESDNQSRKILDRFEELRNINRKIREIRSFRDVPRRLQPPPLVRSLTPQPGSIGNGGGGGGGSAQQSQQNQNAMSEVIDPRELDINLNEMVLISQRSHLYNRFLESRAKAEMEVLKTVQELNNTKAGGAGENAKKLVPTETTTTTITAATTTTSVAGSNKQYNESGLLRVSGLTSKVEEVMDHYLVMEEFFLRRSVDKAMKINERDRGSLTSSCVDDVFYILKKTISRAVYTSNVDCLAAMINFIQRTLEMDYLAEFQKEMQTAFSNGDTGEARLDYMILLNNVNISADYLEKLIVEIEQDCVSSISALSEHALEKARAVLAGLSASINKFKQILNSGIDQLFLQTMKPRLRPLLQDAYKGIKYVVTEEEYAEQEASNSFVNRFMSGFEALIEPLKPCLTEDNFNQIVASAVTSITKTWEKIIFDTRFNKLGAIRFDKDLRSVGFFLVSLTTWPMRDKLTRLNQMSMLLDLEELRDIFDVWGHNAGGAIAWRLTIMEVRRILQLRIDFSSDEVAKLKL
ncbi:Golgi transport complex subunit 4 [Actinomortierella ambigua]|nr:Golgi transport complex subunit 4 [Actinomortierella ambigua]